MHLLGTILSCGLIHIFMGCFRVQIHILVMSLQWAGLCGDVTFTGSVLGGYEGLVQRLHHNMEEEGAVSEVLRRPAV